MTAKSERTRNGIYTPFDTSKPGIFVMEKKVCFKCGKEKQLDEFYVHKQMADGHLNKCKECAKNDVRENYISLTENEEFYEKERARGRDKYHRLGYKDKYKTPKFRNLSYFKNMNKMLKSKGLIKEGEEAHHWNYNLPYSVIILDRKDHKRLHQHIVLNEDTLIYHTKNKDLPLSTLQHHVVFARKILRDIKFYDDIRVF